MASIFIDEKLIELLKTEFTNDEQQKFLEHFQLYLQYGTYSLQHVIDFDNVHEWLGFRQKCHAKRLLIKHFIQDVDYIVNLLSPEEKQVHGGHNKETILLNIPTFKGICMIANTEKGRQTRMYYSKMETIFFKYMDDKHNQLIKSLELGAKQREETLKHNTLLETLNNKRTIYLTRVKTCEDGKFVFKLEWSDGLADRNRSHSTHFGTSLLLDVFECNQNREFELFLKRHPQIARYAYTEPIINNVCSSETYLVLPFEYECILKIIKKNITYYQGYDPKTLVELERLKIISDLTILAKDKKVSESNIVALLQAINVPTLSQIEQENESESESEHDNDTKVNLQAVGRTTVGRKIQKYDPDTLKLIETYQGIMDVLRKHPHMSKFGIKHAACHNTVYNNFRWYILEKSMEVKEYSIPKTVEIQSSIPRLVAMLNKDKTRIENVYASQQEAMEGIGIKRKQTINDAIKKDRIFKNTHYFTFFDNCSDELKNEYMSRASLPSVKVSKA